VYIAIGEFGKRSERDQMRFTPKGPRTLAGSDYGLDGKVWAVVNAPDQRIRREPRREPFVSSMPI